MKTYKIVLAAGLGLIAYEVWKENQKPGTSAQIAAGQLVDIVGGPPHHHGHHGGGGRGRGGWGFGGGWDGGGTTVVLAGSDWVWDPASQTWVLRAPVMTAGAPAGFGPHMASQTAMPPQATWNPPPAPRAQHPMRPSVPRS